MHPLPYPIAFSISYKPSACCAADWLFAWQHMCRCTRHSHHQQGRRLPAALRGHCGLWRILLCRQLGCCAAAGADRCGWQLEGDEGPGYFEPGRGWAASALPDNQRQLLLCRCELLFAASVGLSLVPGCSQQLSTSLVCTNAAQRLCEAAAFVDGLQPGCLEFGAWLRYVLQGRVSWSWLHPCQPLTAYVLLSALPFAEQATH